MTAVVDLKRAHRAPGGAGDHTAVGERSDGAPPGGPLTLPSITTQVQTARMRCVRLESVWAALACPAYFA